MMDALVPTFIRYIAIYTQEQHVSLLLMSGRGYLQRRCTDYYNLCVATGFTPLKV